MVRNIITICIFLCLTFLFTLTACTSSAPTPTLTPIPTPLPTATPTPEPITGTIFWDANGSGLQDETSFIVPDYDQNDLPYFFELLAANGTDISKFAIGDLATVPEPPIPGIEVCLGDICTETGSDGSFTLRPNKNQETFYLKFIDTNADDPIRAFRFINKWNGPVVIESYEKNGFKVSEQHLNDTEVLDIDKGYSFIYENENKVGLMQGFYTAPYYCDDWLDSNPIHGFDHDIRIEYVRDYIGKTQLSTWPGRPGVGDQHFGWDFGTEMGTEVISMAPGNTSNWISDDGGTHVRVDHKGIIDYKGGFSVSLYGHLSEILENNFFEPRGKIVGLAGNSGSTHWVHVHLGTCVNLDPFICRDPFAISYMEKEEEFFGSEGEIVSDESLDNYFRQTLWTVYNLPNCLNNNSLKE